MGRGYEGGRSKGKGALWGSSSSKEPRTAIEIRNGAFSGAAARASRRYLCPGPSGATSPTRRGPSPCARGPGSTTRDARSCCCCRTDSTSFLPGRRRARAAAAATSAQPGFARPPGRPEMLLLLLVRAARSLLPPLRCWRPQCTIPFAGR